MIVFSYLSHKLYGYARKIAESAFFIHLAGKIRRFHLVQFRKKYVEAQLKLREGECRQCARCCSLAFRCPLLTRENLCLTYMKGRPDVCKLFPIGRRDINDVTINGGRCGYWFKENQYKWVIFFKKPYSKKSTDIRG